MPAISEPWFKFQGNSSLSAIAPNNNFTGFLVPSKGSTFETCAPVKLRASAVPPALGKSLIQAASCSPAVVPENSSHLRRSWAQLLSIKKKKQYKKMKVRMVDIFITKFSVLQIPK